MARPHWRQMNWNGVTACEVNAIEPQRRLRYNRLCYN